MKEGIFKFKKFEVSHNRSAMKVGVDGVLIGAWGEAGSDTEGPCRILDIGTGCGVMALMVAQKNSEARFTAVEIDRESAAEALSNFHNSPWGDRISLVEGDISQIVENNDYQDSFDYIISNPPFFSSGISSPTTPREKARHEGSLSPEGVLMAASRLLRKGGKVSLIFPVTIEREMIKAAEQLGLKPLRICKVADSPKKSFKRIMLCCVKDFGPLSDGEEIETLYMRDLDGEYSEAYKILTKEFYLNF